MDFPSSVEQTTLPRARLKKSGFATPTLTQQSLATTAGSAASGVVLDHGRLGGATLSSEVVNRNRYWQWSWAHDASRVPKWNVSGASRQLAPSTRRTYPILAGDDPSPEQLTKSMEIFISSLVDTTDNGTILDIAREELSSMTEKPKPDLFQGCTLELIEDTRTEGQWSAAFTAGELANRLAFLPFDKSQEVGEHEIGLEFPTSILQLSHSPTHPPTHGINHSTLLYVRLHSSVRILRLLHSTYPFDVSEIKTASTDRFRGRRPMDIYADHETWGRALIVDEHGGIWVWQLSVARDGIEDELSCLREALPVAKESYRVGSGTQMDTVVVASSSRVDVVEALHASVPPTAVYQTPREAFVIALEQTGSARHSLWTCICTSDSLVWIDDRKPLQPALSWKHSRGPDPTLNVVASDTPGDACRYILWSRQSLLITVYTISKTSPARSLCEPYVLAVPSFYPGFQLQSLAGTPKSHSADASALLLLSTTGAVFFMPLHYKNTEEESTAGLPLLEPRLDPAEREEIGDKDGKRHQTYSFIHVWTDLHADPTAEIKGISPDLTALAFTAGPVLTGTDWLAGRVTAEALPRSAFLRITQIQVPYMASIKDSIAIFEATAGADIDICSPARYLLGFDPSDSDLALHLESKYFGDLNEEDECDHDLMLKQSWAAQLLARDLQLSSVVLNTRATRDTTDSDPPPPASPDDLRARVAAALSLQDSGPPPIMFNYLQPKVNKSLANPTAQALLSEWTLGEDPSKFVWKAPDKVATPVPGSPALDRPTRSMPQSSPFARPRSPMPQTQPAFGLTRSDSLGGSLRVALWPREQAASLRQLPRPPAESSPERPQSSPIQPAIQTQVLSGPFGGRTAPKKKPKKRVAGF